jgi:DNA polymerase IIIc chi subunit
MPPSNIHSVLLIKRYIGNTCKHKRLAVSRLLNKCVQKRVRAAVVILHERESETLNNLLWIITID